MTHRLERRRQWSETTTSTSSTTTTTTPAPPTVRINAGGPAYAAADGTTYLADTDFSGGSVGTTVAAIAGTADPALYQNERYGGWGYTIPVADGVYDLRLDFVELYYNAPCTGKRVFSLDVVNTPVRPDIANLDICATVGPDTALVKTIAAVPVTDGSIRIDSIYGASDNPEITAIEVALPGSADTQPPTSPTGLQVSGSDQTSITLAWNASTDNVAVAGYDLFVNGKKIGSTSATSYTFAGLTCGTAYTLTVDAYDAAGNRSTPTAATATTTACPAIAAGVKLAFAPPALASPTTILLGNPTRSLSLNAAKDYILELPPYPVKPGPDGGIWVDGGHNIVIIGGAIDFTGVVNSCCTEDQGRVATFMNTTGTVHVEGLWAYGSGLVEGIQMFSPQASLQVENCRFDHLHTTQYALHSDLIQFNDGRDLRVDRFTGSSEVQGVFRTNPEGGAAILDHVNMQGLQGSSDSSPRLLWQGGDWWPMALDNVWIQPRSGQPIGMAVWPGTTYSNNAYAAFINPDGTLGWSAATRISGVVHAGVPTNGDFVPVGVAGASYVSPGY
jgi:hypothetical protein